MIAQRGMTLVEIVFASAILIAFLMMTMIFMGSLTEGANLQNQVSELDKASEKALDAMTEELQSGFVPSNGWYSANWVAPLQLGSNTIRFVVPVDHDGDGDEIDGSLNAEYGCMRPDYTPEDFPFESNTTNNDFFIMYVFTQTGTLAESAPDIDLNGDGDTADTFTIGLIEKVFPAATCTTPGATHQNQTVAELRQPLTPRVVAVGDGDGDGVADPIFTLNGSQLIINLYTINSEAQQPILRQLQSRIDMRNMP
jgi:type II secretory pathway pseudopilin PulG